MSPPTSSSIPKRGYKELQNCMGLLSQKNYKQAEIEFKRFVKNYADFKDCLLPKALSLYFDALHHRLESFDEDFTEFMNGIKTVSKDEDDKMIPYIMVDTFYNLQRPDKAAEICKIYCCRYEKELKFLKFYFESMVHLRDFNEQFKIALKMHRLEESETNKFQLCTAAFLQASSKSTQKEREMGFEFAEKLAEKVFADNPEHLAAYLKSVKDAKEKYVKKPFLDGSVLNVEAVGTEEYEKAMVPKNEASEDEMKQSHEIFNSKLNALKEGSRNEKLWHETIAMMNLAKTADPKTDTYSSMANFFQDLLQQSPNHQFEEKDDLYACIKFLNIVKPENYGLGTVAERIEEYTKRFGHDFSESQRILHCFDDLSVDDKKSIIESSNKILSILKPYICQKFEIGLPSNVYDKRQEIIEQKDVEALEGAFVPTNSSSVTLAYFHRLFLTDRMTLLSGSNAKVSDMEQMISRWIKIIDVLEKYFVDESEQILICQNFFEQIIASSSELLFGIYGTFGNLMYIEVLTCLLNYRKNKQSLPFDIAIPNFLSNCHFLLGFGTYFKEYMAGTQFLRDSFVSNFILENTAHFKAAHVFYLRLMEQKSKNFLRDVMFLKENYVKGRIENVCTMYKKIDQKSNDISTARYFARAQFLSAAFGSFSDFCDEYVRDVWPIDLPHHSYIAPFEYCSTIAEIQTIRILCNFLVIFFDYNNTTAFNLVQEDIDYYLEVLNAQNSVKEKNEDEKDNKDPTIVPNIFANPELQPFLQLISIFVKSSASVLSKPVDEILNGLPDVSKFQECVDEVSKVLHDIFRQKFKNVQRIQAMSDIVKMIHYMSRLVAVIYSAIVKSFIDEKSNFEANEEFEQILLRFRQYSVELKLLMEIVSSMAFKFMSFLDRFPLRNDADKSLVTVYAVCTYTSCRYDEYTNSLYMLTQSQELSSLIECGLLKKEFYFIN